MGREIPHTGYGGLKHVEDALLESDARMNSIIQGSPLPQFVIDKDHRVISWNRAIEEYSGVKAAEILGKRVPWTILYNTERPILADLLVDEKIELLPGWYQGKTANRGLLTERTKPLISSPKWAHPERGFFSLQRPSGMPGAGLLVLLKHWKTSPKEK
jgi:PAS domain-containing protein